MSFGLVVKNTFIFNTLQVRRPRDLPSKAERIDHKVCSILLIFKWFWKTILITCQQWNNKGCCPQVSVGLKYCPFHIHIFSCPKFLLWNSPGTLRNAHSYCPPWSWGIITAISIKMVFSLAAASFKKLQSCPTLRDPMDSLQLRLLCPWDSPGKNSGVLCHALLQGIFLTQGLNPYLLLWQVGSFPLAPPGNPHFH